MDAGDDLKVKGYGDPLLISEVLKDIAGLLAKKLEKQKKRIHDLVLDDTYFSQPILIPGDMGTASYVMVGHQRAMEETFGSTCHGAGRVLSRTAAKKKSKGRSIGRELEDKGILVRWTGRWTMAEEMPEAYKDVSEVVAVVHGAGVSKKVARLKPIAVVKG